MPRASSRSLATWNDPRTMVGSPMTLIPTILPADTKKISHGRSTIPERVFRQSSTYRSRWRCHDRSGATHKNSPYVLIHSSNLSHCLSFGIWSVFPTTHMPGGPGGDRPRPRARSAFRTRRDAKSRKSRARRTSSLVRSRVGIFMIIAVDSDSRGRV